MFRAIAAEVRSKVQPLAGTRRGQKIVGTGAGGDRTVYLDALAEGIVVEHLQRAYRSGRRFRLLSEELGSRDFGGSELVLVDPLDGSLNAKQGLPYYAIVLASAASEQVKDVACAYVQNLVTGDEFTAQRHGGALRNGVALEPSEPGFDGSRYRVLQLDAPSPLAAIQKAMPLIGRAERLRQLGSASLNLCYTATGGIDLQAAPVPVRAFDLAGPLLILKEAGGIATDFEGHSLEEVSVALDSRTTMLASASGEIHAFARRVLSEASPAGPPSQAG